MLTICDSRKRVYGCLCTTLEIFFETVSKQKVSPHICIKILNIYSKNITN